MAQKPKFRWSQAWAERLGRSNHRTRLQNTGLTSEEFWDSFSTWQKLHTYTNYPGRLMERILPHVDAGDTVVDIGAGGGALTIPLAGAARHVIAIEPSPGQVERLMAEASREQLTNVTAIVNRWEDVDPAALGRVDVITAAYCFQMEDIETALDKMVRTASKHVFLVHFVDHDLVKPLTRIMSEFQAGPDYHFLNNVLYDMGYYAGVEIIKRDFDIPLDFQMEVLGYSHGLSPEQQHRLTESLLAAGRIHRHNGEPVLSRWYKDALVWIDKDGCQDRQGEQEGNQ